MRKDGSARMAREKKAVEVMVEMFCSARHGTGIGLCEECARLLDYARQRLDKCPFGDEKGPCAKCAMHCYIPSMRAGIVAVMKYAGPRMILRHPVLALRHGRS